VQGHSTFVKIPRERIGVLIGTKGGVRELIEKRLSSDISRIKGRIIGREGKTRRIIEEMTGTRVSVYGHTVSMIGGIEQVDIAREAIKMLIKGNQHKTVYRFLQRKRHELKLRSLELWQSETPRDLGI